MPLKSFYYLPWCDLSLEKCNGLTVPLIRTRRVARRRGVGRAEMAAEQRRRRSGRYKTAAACLYNIVYSSTVKFSKGSKMSAEVG